MTTNPRRRAIATAAALLLTCVGCTVLVDRSATQCQNDGDCAHFGGRPSCQSGACVASGLGPANCFYGTPQAPEDFLNQCSNAQCLSFDNCQRLGICHATDGNASLVPPPPLEPAIANDAGAGGDAVAALPSCADAANGRAQVIYITGSSNFPPLLSKLAPLILATGYTPVYQVTSSCAGVKSMFSDQPSDQLMTDPPPGSNAKYAAFFQQDGSAVPCSLGASGARVQIGESDIFSSTCTGFGAPPAGTGEYLGPIQTMAFVVPGRSRETAITAEAARAVFGMGGANAAAAPWTNPSLYFIRNANTGTQQMIGHAIGVPATAFWGIDRGTAASVDAQLRIIADDALAQNAIGIISTDYYDADRANLKALAYKAPGQSCAYGPDSTDFRKDKRNVRDGHYPIWGPLHFFTPVANGVPVSAAAQAFVSVVSLPNLPKPLLDAFIASSLVPTCAMSVQRTSELGPLAPYSPPFRCGCYFEANPAINDGTPQGCTRCVAANDCTDPKRPACNLGYCEVE